MDGLYVRNLEQLPVQQHTYTQNIIYVYIAQKHY